MVQFIANSDSFYREHCHEFEDTSVPCTGGCGEMVPDTSLGDPYCADCMEAAIPEDVRAMAPWPPRQTSPPGCH